MSWARNEITFPVILWPVWKFLLANSNCKWSPVLVTYSGNVAWTGKITLLQLNDILRVLFKGLLPSLLFTFSRSPVTSAFPQEMHVCNFPTLQHCQKLTLGSGRCSQNTYDCCLQCSWENSALLRTTWTAHRSACHLHSWSSLLCPAKLWSSSSARFSARNTVLCSSATAEVLRFQWLLETCNLFGALRDVRWSRKYLWRTQYGLQINFC